MKKSLLLIFLIVHSALSLHAQKDSVSITDPFHRNSLSGEASNINVSIFPVPVRENTLTIKTDRDFSFVKITNIIGQDIFRTKYNNPQQLVKILLDNPKRGMYLVTITFSDGKRVVKKIMIEESD